MTPDHFQTVALAWLGAISVVGGAAFALVVKNWTTISDAIVAIAQLRARLNMHDVKAGIDTVTPTTPPVTQAVPPPPPKAPDFPQSPFTPTNPKP